MAKRKFRIIDSLLNKVPTADHFCEICGTKARLSVHHIKERSDGGDDDPDNLMVLCTRHHRQIHNFKLPNLKVVDKYEKLVKLRALKRRRDTINYQIEKLLKEIKLENGIR